MSISVVVNTCAAAERGHKCNHSGVEYAERAEPLTDVVLPRLRRDPLVHEIIVVGEYWPGDGYRYIESPSTWRDCRDALDQRHVGAQTAAGDVVMFMHDDHLPTSDFFDILTHKYLPQRWDILSLIRRLWSVTGPQEHVVNRGHDYDKSPYIMGHGCVMRRAALDVLPWSDVKRKVTWDTSHTELARLRGLRRLHARDLVLYDIELGDIPPCKSSSQAPQDSSGVMLFSGCVPPVMD